MVTVLAFDLGGVLFSDGTTEFADYLCETFGTDRAHAMELLNGALGSAYREGKLTRDEFWAGFRRGLGLPVPADDLEARWFDGYRVNEGTRDLIRDLAPHYDVYYLSDNVAERIEAVERRSPFLHLFKGGVFSHEAGIRKPDPGIYELLLATARADAREVLFVDDKEPALVPAARLGMRTVLFRDIEQVRRDLRRLGCRW
ncbi:HAD family hydrolase [Longispora albida]|uniref:HAD family hydrolase n=1 Tax=Longispora albida TaxID=203523 RepID=UPI00035F802A|nr:HAD family phosphatase [Longispora albida]